MAAAAARTELLRLDGERRRIEADIGALREAHASVRQHPACARVLMRVWQHGVAPEDALIDRDGFPRSDVDVAALRTMRHTLACLQTDLATTMRAVEAALARSGDDDGMHGLRG
jgi:hypothetical protein